MVRGFLVSVFMAFGVAVSSSYAQSPEMPSLISAAPAKEGRASAMPEGVLNIDYNSALAHSSMRPGAPVQVTLPGGTKVILNFEKSQQHPSGSRTWVGRVAGSSKPYKAIITDDGEHVFGRIVTPEGAYLLRTTDGVQQLLAPRAAGLEVAPHMNDGALPPAQPANSADQNAAKSIPLYESNGPTDMATIDVLLAYSSGLADELGSGLQTQLDYLIALANQAYEDSEIYQRVRVVHSVEVDYSDTATTNGDTLDAMTPAYSPSVPAALSELPDLRDTYGADLVALIRRFRYPEQGGGCGVAWVSGSGSSGSVSGLSHLGYSVSSVGSDIIYFCSDLTLVHELGHNMGSTHDRGHSSFAGVFPYSYGHGYEHDFGTVMSYLNPEVAVFSNPSIDCNGLPCGIADPDPESADNARSINNTRFDVAAFRATEVPESCAPGDILALEYDSIAVAETEIACKIVAGPSYSVLSTADVVFSANESITLGPGFRVETGGEFTAIVDPRHLP